MRACLCWCRRRSWTNSALAEAERLRSALEWERASHRDEQRLAESRAEQAVAVAAKAKTVPGRMCFVTSSPVLLLPLRRFGTCAFSSVLCLLTGRRRGRSGQPGSSWSSGRRWSRAGRRTRWRWPRGQLCHSNRIESNRHRDWHPLQCFVGLTSLHVYMWLGGDAGEGTAEGSATQGAVASGACSGCPGHTG